MQLASDVFELTTILAESVKNEKLEISDWTEGAVADSEDEDD
jgi:hypothetical protein